MSPARARLLLPLLLPACGAATTPLIPDWDGGVIPSCRQATLDAPDASRQACAAAAQLLTCQDPSGANEVCISNDAVCTGAGSDCQGRCHGGDEYAVACDGRIGQEVQPPAGCQAMEGSPSATVYYCCPCTP